MTRDKLIVLAMHGALALDFPKDKLQEFFSLHGRMDHSHDQPSDMPKRYRELENQIRKWPRTRENDPFWAGANDLRDALAGISGLDVILGFNEFCAPSLDSALDDAASRSPSRIIVVTPMMTRGGEHSERDIRGAIDRTKARHPGLDITYAWPFPTSRIAEFLFREMERFI